MGEQLPKMPAQAKERDYWFDNAKAILIILVVVAHMAENLVSGTSFEGGKPAWLITLYRGIYIFHMPVFLVVSGRFAKNRINRNDWVTVINKLIVPYLVLQTVMMVFYSFTGYASVSGFSYLSPLFGTWYIITIAVYQLITPHFRKVKGFFVISLIVAIGMQFGEAVPKGGFMRLFTYYPFFLVGYLTADWDLSFCKKTWFRILSVMAFVVLFAVVWIKPSYFPVGALTLKRVYTAAAEFFKGMGEWEFLAYTLCHYAVGILFFFFIMGITPAKKNFFTHVGTQSTYVYMLHLFIIVLCRALDKKYEFLDFFNTDLKAAIHVLCAIPLSFLLASGPVRKAMRWLVSPDFNLGKLLKQADKG